MAITVRELRPEDDRSRFRSGDVELDRFFWKYAGRARFRHHIGTTYVAVDGDEILGYATVSTSEIVLEETTTTRGRGGFPMTVLRLARLAVDATARGQGVDRMLLKSAFVLARRLSENEPCAGVVADARPETEPFYASYGFVPFPAASGHLGERPEPRPMFLELGAIPSPSPK